MTAAKSWDLFRTRFRARSHRNHEQVILIAICRLVAKFHSEWLVWGAGLTYRSLIFRGDSPLFHQAVAGGS
jgi:hypothetical protein